MKVSGRKEIIKIRAKINEKEVKKAIAKINKTESWLLENINKTDSSRKKGEKSNQQNQK